MKRWKVVEAHTIGEACSHRLTYSGRIWNHGMSATIIHDLLLSGDHSVCPLYFPVSSTMQNHPYTNCKRHHMAQFSQCHWWQLWRGSHWRHFPVVSLPVDFPGPKSCCCCCTSVIAILYPILHEVLDDDSQGSFPRYWGWHDTDSYQPSNKIS